MSLNDSDQQQRKPLLVLQYPDPRSIPVEFGGDAFRAAADAGGYIYLCGVWGVRSVQRTLAGGKAGYCDNAEDHGNGATGENAG